MVISLSHVFMSYNCTYVNKNVCNSAYALPFKASVSQAPASPYSLKPEKSWLKKWLWAVSK